VFDRAIDDLCITHWANISFDGFPVTPIHVNVLVKVQHTMIMYVRGFLSSPLRDIKAGK